MTCLSLPQAELGFEEEVRAGRLLVLGGRAPAAAWLRQVAAGRSVWAVDLGAESCRLSGITPDHALGDFDSVGDEGREWLRRLGVESEVYPPDKDYTDFQLALRRSRGDLLVTGCWGGRFDHAFANVFSALWGMEWGVRVRAFADESEVLVPLFDGDRLALRFRTAPLAVSLLPLSSFCEISVHGTKWELSAARLRLERPYAVSNVPTAEEVFVEAGGGAVGVYCVFGGAESPS
jgi:thiamine pyrophosphokinase